MLTAGEIKTLILEDNSSIKKKLARTGDRYYDGDHDIKNYRFFYFDTNGVLQEDKFRSNVKIPHPFFKELTDEATQYILSDDSQIIASDDDKLQEVLDLLFNNNDDFTYNLSELLTDVQTKGFAYMYMYSDENYNLNFVCADSLGVVEVDAKWASDNMDHVIYWYIDRINLEGDMIKKIQDWTSENVAYWIQTNEGEIKEDNNDEGFNVRPHVLYKIGNEDKVYYDTYGLIPFFRIDNNRKQLGNLKPIKEIIDDYDVMSSSLSNNLIDFDNPLYVIKGYEGDNLDELQTNLKTKKIVGTDAEGDISVKTVDVPYEARVKKLELDEKNIYRFGMGLNLSSLKDTSATTNMAIKAAYSLLDLRCKKLEKQARKFLKKIVTIAIDDYNKRNNTGYDVSTIRYEFNHSIIANEQEQAQIELTEAQTQQTEVNTLLSAANTLQLSDSIIKALCQILDIDYEEVKKAMDKDTTYNAKASLNNKTVEEDETPEVVDVNE